jgi:hypothetical protein
MRVGLVDVHLNEFINQVKVRKMPKSRTRTPNCTHVNMDRVYGTGHVCCVCGRSPSIGFLYACVQDHDTQSLQDILSKENVTLREPAKSDLRLELELLGMSESVIITAEEGFYNDAQLGKLKNQKKKLRQTISDTLQGSQINDAVAKLAAVAQEPSNNDGALNSKLTGDAVSGLQRLIQSVLLSRSISMLSLQLNPIQSPPACALKACHACRPYYRDRVYISLESVLTGDFPPLTPEDMQKLPVKSAQIMRTIGLTHQASSSSSIHDSTPPSLPTSTSLTTSTDAPPTTSTTTSVSSDTTFQTTQTDLDEISAQRRPRHRFYKMGRRTSTDIARDLSLQNSRLTRQGLKTAFQGIFRPSRESSSTGSNITLPLPRTGTVREPKEVGEFDLPALRKVRKEKEKNDVKNGTYRGGFEDVHVAGKTLFGGHAFTTSAGLATDSSESDFSVYSCASEGSEVEVDGGVALTEEAVETHTPNVLAVDVSSPKDGAVVQGFEKDDENDDDDDDEVDVGLQSIMTQL